MGRSTVISPLICSSGTSMYSFIIRGPDSIIGNEGMEGDMTKQFSYLRVISWP